MTYSILEIYLERRNGRYLRPDSVGESQQTVASPGESSALIQRQKQPVSTHRSKRTVKVSSRQSSRGPTAVESQGESCEN